MDTPSATAPGEISSSSGATRGARFVPEVVATELGVERKCRGCGEFWPLDTDFFSRQPGGFRGFQAVCKACLSEQRNGGEPRQYRSLDLSRINAMLAIGRTPREIAELVGCSVGAVYRRKRAA
jgi:hypothetical protein